MDKKWWHVVVEYENVIDDEKGKAKKIKEEHFVQAISPTDVEVIVTKEMVEIGYPDFKWKKLQPTNVSKILTSEGPQLAH